MQFALTTHVIDFPGKYFKYVFYYRNELNLSKSILKIDLNGLNQIRIGFSQLSLIFNLFELQKNNKKINKNKNQTKIGKNRENFNNNNDKQQANKQDDEYG